MKPKKRIILIDGDGQTMSLRSFLLATLGYKVLPATTQCEALAALQAGPVDLVVINLDFLPCAASVLVDRLKGVAKGAGFNLPILITSNVISGYLTHRADCFLDKNLSTPKDLRERVRVMSARKRGPQKLIPEKVSADEPEEMVG